MLALRVEGLQAALGQNLILNQVSFSVNESELAALVGANGAGKTTLLKVLAGRIRPAAGKIEIFGKPCSPATRKLISYLPQKSNLDPRFPLCVADVVQLGRTSWSFFHRNRKKETERVEWCLEQVGLTGLAKRPIGELSGGQQQLAFLARTLYGNPRLVLLDEPTTGLDVTARQRFYKLLKELKQRLGLTFLIVTHDWEAVLAHADRVMLLEAQKITFQGCSQKAGEVLKPCLRVVDRDGNA
ncbi:MAG: ABC transporter ATP-binding protein [Clostridia bacterium]|nr:ABC transporter ATP-binding protein [Clostridia bacterium]